MELPYLCQWCGEPMDPHGGDFVFVPDGQRRHQDCPSRAGDWDWLYHCAVCDQHVHQEKAGGPMLTASGEEHGHPGYGSGLGLTKVPTQRVAS